MTKRTAPTLFLFGLLAGGGCSGSAPDAPVDYHHDAQAVLQRYCTTCHRDGGIAPFVLTDYQAAKNSAMAMKAAVMAGKMPPWLPDDAGVPLKYSRKMRPQDQDLLLRWIDSGAPEGDPSETPRSDIPPADTVQPPRPDIVLDPGATYQPNQQVTDDYHCFVLDPKLDQDKYLQAGDVMPGNPGIVHHVLIFEILKADVPKLAAMGPGYTCFGGPGVGNRGQTVLGWAPGGVPTRTPEGTALKLSAGSMLVMQVHYNLLNYKGTGDRTVAHLEVTTTPPKQVALLLPIADPQHLYIAAGDAHAKQVISVPVAFISTFLKYPAGSPITVYANAPHMHLLGKHITTSVEDGPMLVDVPQWDFHWQQFFSFQTPFVLRSSDTLRVECDYDNSAANQPLLNGQRQQPHDVSWGEKTTDEMCLSYLYITPGSGS